MQSCAKNILRIHFWSWICEIHGRTNLFCSHINGLLLNSGSLLECKVKNLCLLALFTLLWVKYLFIFFLWTVFAFFVPFCVQVIGLSTYLFLLTFISERLEIRFVILMHFVHSIFMIVLILRLCRFFSWAQFWVISKWQFSVTYEAGLRKTSSLQVPWKIPILLSGPL